MVAVPQLTAAAEMPSRVRNWRREVEVEVKAAGMADPCRCGGRVVTGWR